MAEQLTVHALLEVLLKGGNLPKELQDNLRNLQNQSKRTTSEFGLMGDAATRLRNLLVGALGGAALTRLATSSLTEFAKIERGLNGIAFQLDRLGIGGKQDLPAIKAVLKAIQDGGGALQTETIPIFSRFIGITKNVNAALELTKLAADAGESGFIDTGRAAEAFASLLQGRVAGAATALGIELNKANGVQKTSVELLDEAIKKFSGLGDSTNDTQNKIETLAGEWASFKETLGSGLTVLTNVTGGLTALTKVIQSVGPSLVIVAALYRAFFNALAQGLAKVLDLKALLKEGPSAYIAAVQEATLAGLSSMKNELAGAAIELNAIWEKTGEKSGEAEGKARAEALAALRAIALKADKEAQDKADAEKLHKAQELAQKQLELELAANEKLNQARLAAVQKGGVEELQARINAIQAAYAKDLAAADATEEAKKTLRAARDAEIRKAEDDFFRDREERELESEKRILQAKIDLSEDGSERRLELMKKVLDVEEKLQLLSAERTESEKESIRQAAALSRLALDKVFAKEESAARLEEEHATIEAALEDTTKSLNEQYDLRRQLLNNEEAAELEGAQDNAAKRSAIEAKYRTARMRLDKQEARAKMDAQEAVFLQLGAFLTAAFGNTKAVAIANAIISTYVAANKALEQYGYPYGAIVAALVIATGLANVRKIVRTNPQAGFDDPRNDSLAKIAARKWADDWIKLSTQGFGERLRQRMAAIGPNSMTAGLGRELPVSSQSITNSYDSRMTITVNGLYGGRFGLAQLARELDRARALDPQRVK